MSSTTGDRTPTSPASTPRRPKKHRVSDDAVAQKQHLQDAKKKVVKALKKVQTQQRIEQKAAARLLAKASKLTVEQVVAIVDMKTEMPDIVCSHCSRGIKTGPELRKAYRDTLAGIRKRHCDAPGKPLVVSE